MFLISWFTFFSIFLLITGYTTNTKWTFDCLDDKCKTRSDGFFTTVQEFPHSVRIEEGSFLCGGSVLTEKTILTAATCVYNDPEKNKDLEKRSALNIYAGHEDYKNKSAVHRTVKDSICHPCFNYSTFRYNIAVLLIDKAFTFGIIRPIRIRKDWPQRIFRANTSGWGEEYENSPLPRKLKFVEMRVNSQRTCCIIMRKTSDKRLHEGEFCAGSRYIQVKRGISTQGDSGAGLIVSQDLLIGVICTTCNNIRERPGIVMVYNASYHFDFIMKSKQILEEK